MQENERRRIGRELHDDIGQRLALLSVDLSVLAQGAYPSQPGFSEQLESLRKQVHTLSTDVQKLSHQIHPGKSDQLGLVTTLKGFFREIQGKTHVSIEFSETNMSFPLDPELPLCVYRIIQEGIWNVVKHSGVKEAAIDLAAESDMIHVCIRDNGVGFPLARQWKSKESDC